MKTNIDRFTKAYLKVISEGIEDTNVSEDAADPTAGKYCFSFEGTGDTWVERCTKAGFDGEVKPGFNGSSKICTMYVEPERLEEAKNFILKSVFGTRRISTVLDTCDYMSFEITDDQGNPVEPEDFFA